MQKWLVSALYLVTASLPVLAQSEEEKLLEKLKERTNTACIELAHATDNLKCAKDDWVKANTAIEVWLKEYPTRESRDQRRKELNETLQSFHDALGKRLEDAYTITSVHERKLAIDLITEMNNLAVRLHWAKQDKRKGADEIVKNLERLHSTVRELVKKLNDSLRTLDAVKKPVVEVKCVLINIAVRDCPKMDIDALSEKVQEQMKRMKGML